MTMLHSLSPKKILKHEFPEGINDCVLIFLNLSDYNLNSLQSYIRDEDFKNAKNFKNILYQNRFLLKKGILNYFLCQYLNCKINDFQISQTKYKKPYIKDTPLFFNVSDSDNYYTLSFSKHFTIGVDIEVKRKIKNPLCLAKRFFSNDEISYLEKSASRNEDFLCLWTQKEAYVKCLGQGISYGLNSFSIIRSSSGFKIFDKKSKINSNGKYFFNSKVFFSICYQNNDICIYQDYVNLV